VWKKCEKMTRPKKTFFTRTRYYVTTFWHTTTTICYVFLRWLWLLLKSDDAKVFDATSRRSLIFWLTEQLLAWSECQATLTPPWWTSGARRLNEDAPSRTKRESRKAKTKQVLKQCVDNIFCDNELQMLTKDGCVCPHFAQFSCAPLSFVHFGPGESDLSFWHNSYFNIESKSCWRFVFLCNCGYEDLYEEHRQCLRRLRRWTMPNTLSYLPLYFCGFFALFSFFVQTDQTYFATTKMTSSQNSWNPKKSNSKEKSTFLFFFLSCRSAFSVMSLGSACCCVELFCQLPPFFGETKPKKREQQNFNDRKTKHGFW